MAKKKRKLAKGPYVCTNCEYIGQAYQSGSFWLGLVLWCCYIVPGLLYTIWCMTTAKNVCPKCGQKTMLSVKLPKGEKLRDKIWEENNQ